MSMISVTGEVEYSYLLPGNKEKLIKITQDSNSMFTIGDDSIYLNDINNENHFIEEYALIVAKMLPLDHENIVFKCDGLTILDRMDVVIQQNKVYIQEYTLEKAELKEYTSIK